jgi:hypothetical protein
MRVLLILICFSLSILAPAQNKKNGKVKIPFDRGYETGKLHRGQKHGVWRRYDAEGRMVYQMTYTKGIKNGAEFSNNFKDTINSSGYYVNGLRHGGFISLKNGHAISFFNYQNDTLQGNCFFNSPEKSFEGYYDHGKKAGTWVIDSIEYKGDRIKDSTSYVHGLKEGSSFLFVNSVLVSRSEWEAGKRNGAYMEYHEKTGSLATEGGYFNNNKHGIWKNYSNGKLISIEEYENGIHVANTFMYGKDTSVIIAIMKYNPDGSKQMAQYNDASGTLQHRWYYGPQEDVDSIITYYPNGKVKEGHYTAYENNDGFTQFYLYLSYYSNGALQTRGFEYKNARNGTWLSYDSTGHLIANMHYEENMPFGWFQTYYSNGKLKLKAYCYEAITDTILVYSKNGVRLQQSDPMYSKTIAEVQSAFPSITFRDPNKFPPEHHKRGHVSLGETINEGVWSEEPASFPGGSDSLKSFIAKNINYPEPERRLGIQGIVVIRFLVEKDGSLSDIQVAQHVKDAPGFTKETLRMMRLMPKWKPAQTKGKIVRVYYNLPVEFSLE